MSKRVFLIGAVLTLLIALLPMGVQAAMAFVSPLANDTVEGTVTIEVTNVPTGTDKVKFYQKPSGETFTLIEADTDGSP